MKTFSDFIGNAPLVAAIRSMLAEDRLPQTLLFAGPRGVGKATLARLIAAALNCADHSADPCGRCGQCERILRADLSQPEFQTMFEERAKLPAAKRVENPLVVSTHPDFLIFPPDGPLQIIGIEQARRLRSAAQFAPSEGRGRIFLIDHADRANDEAANSLLKTLEEPAPNLTIILTAENPYDLLPTIRSRSIPFYFAPLSGEEMRRFLQTQPGLSPDDRERLASLSQGSPGRASTLDLGVYTKRRDGLLTLLRASLGQVGFAELMSHTEELARKRDERLSLLTETLHGLLHDILHLYLGLRRSVINADILDQLAVVAQGASFPWVEGALHHLSEIDRLERRNIQKQLALEAMAARLRTHA